MERRCVPCEEGSVTPLSRGEAEKRLLEVPGWILADDAKSIRREFEFPNFVTAVDFVNTITDIAEEEGHHPDLEVAWGKVVVTLSTHSIKGLSENDYIVAERINALKK